MYFQPDDLDAALKPSDVTSNMLTPEFISRILSPQVERSLRISPYRQASFSHLRDGFAKAVESRWSKIHFSESERMEQLNLLQQLKQLFPKTNFCVGDELILSVRGNTLRLFHNVSFP